MKKQLIEKIYRVVIYLRLSSDDGDNRESDSISNQRILARSYVDGKPEFVVVKECVDDGFSGTNFNRPGFQEMMKLIENGEADCIIVKDLSRFGRDFSGVLQYVERVLPKMGVRLILINDNYDSIEPNHDFLSLRLKSLINDIYPAETSRSVRSNLYAKMVHGQCVAPFATYGFLKSPEDRHKLMIDPVAGSVVYDIFYLKLKGHSLKDIADILNIRGILPPLAYKRIYLKQKLSTGFRVTGENKWAATMIRRILMDERFTGVLIQGKTTTPNHKVKKVIRKSENDWIRYEDAFDAVIDRHVYEVVQNLIAVNDFYDSNDTLMTRKDTEAKFKNLLNGLYPQICSRNIKQVKKAKAKEGNYHGSVPTFGYLFKEDDRKSLVLDKEVSWIVRYIFDERIKGVKYTEIARILNEKKIITPIEHFRKKGYKMPSKNVTPLWNINMIRKILANPTYTGAVVNNKTDNMIVSVKSPKAIPREDWICVANKHEAIVTMDEMKIVMGMIKPVNTYHKKLEVPRNIFRSKVKCGHCQRMLRVRDRGPERIKMSCTTPTKISDTKCYRGSILAKDIENLVLQLIRQQALLSIDALGKIKEINKTLDIPRLRKQKGYYEAKIDSGKQEKMDMYELCVLGEIHTETFLEKKEILSRKECQYKQKVLKLKEKIAAAEEEKQKEQDCFLRKFAQYADLETLTYPIVQELVDMIYFYDHEHIEVIWNYADEFIKVSGESFDC